ncbi:MAG: TatD family hydrolase [Tannerella sp.]|jgi:TatD DNase family protein|nr:TatD family hydrolase [Tannerella sp.]
MTYIDVHTHNKNIPVGTFAIVSIDLTLRLSHDISYAKGVFYSAGVHPWHPDVRMMPTVRALAAMPEIIAIGETGLDKLTAGKYSDFTRQRTLFIEHIHLSEEVAKPMIIHCVKSHNEIISIHRELKPKMPWIIHGFRGNQQIAKELLYEGFYLSFSIPYNKYALLSAWRNDRLLIETDDKPLSIDKVYELIATDLQVSVEILSQEIAVHQQNSVFGQRYPITKGM